MEKSKNYLRKIKKKQIRSQKIMENATGVTCCVEPTINIAICNAGLVNGLSEEEVFQHFAAFGPVESIVMLPGKSCCFLSFKDKDSATKAYESANGILRIGQNENPIFLGFVIEMPQNTFEYSINWPKGLTVIKNFVTAEEEATIMGLYDFASNDFEKLKFRRVKHFGFEFNYGVNNVNKHQPMDVAIPDSFSFIIKRFKSNPEVDFHPDQLTINYYEVGGGIPPHVDTHSAFTDTIVSLSLGSGVNMEFRNEDSHVSLHLPRRSLLVMKEDCRYVWNHAITPRISDMVRTENGLNCVKRDIRVSYTFRKVLEGACSCSYPEKCDSQQENIVSTIDENMANRLEEIHVHDIYEEIADHFSETRHKAWPNVLDFLRCYSMGSVLLDVGCGNGKYLGQNTDIFSIGCDRSSGLLSVCVDRQFSVFQCNCLSISVRDHCIDCVICIAVIHHLSTEQRRIDALKEIVRVLVVGGRALISVWSREQTVGDTKTSYLKQDRKNRCSSVKKSHPAYMNVDSQLRLPLHSNREEFQEKDMLVPWKLKSANNKELLRFYHVFVENELAQLCSRIDNIVIIKTYYTQGNWCIIFEKIKQ